MDLLESKQESKAYSFKQLIEIKKKEYLKEADFDKKEEIVSKFICDPEVSYNFLKESIENALKTKADPDTIFNNIDSYFSCLKYSLSKEKNNEIYELIKSLNLKSANKFYKYLAFNDPINNFKDIHSKFALFQKEMNDNDKTKSNLEKIDEYIDEMLQIYNIDLQNYYYPPINEYPNYVYNYYSFLFYKTLKKFRKKKTITQQFATTTNQTLNQISNQTSNQISNQTSNQISNQTSDETSEYTDEEKKVMYYFIAVFFNDISKLLNKFKSENIYNDLMTLKIIFFYFKNLEYLRNYSSFRDTFLKVINCLDSEPITSNILNRFKFFRKNNGKKVEEKDWNSIGINEILYIDNNPLYPVKIKHFKNDILKLDDINLLYSLTFHSIDDLNINGLIQNSIIKYDDKIEEYSKKLLKNIFSSEMYINNFLFHDNRFKSDEKKKKELLESMFKGENKDAIFEEIWDNIFFLPFPNHDFAGFNNRPQYAIFINSKPEINPNPTFQKIIPRFHSDLNTLFHEFTHNIALLLVANLEDDEFGTLIKNDNDNLFKLQEKYNNKLYKDFDDLGDLMEVKLYGIRPKTFKTFSGLFCLNCDSYKYNSSDFREICVALYNAEINNNKESEEKGMFEKYDLKKILEYLMNSEIANLLKEYFVVGKEFKNESFTESGKSRKNYGNYFHNEEFSVNNDYCDKLDKI